MLLLALLLSVRANTAPEAVDAYLSELRESYGRIEAGPRLDYGTSATDESVVVRPAAVAVVTQLGSRLLKSPTISDGASELAHGGRCTIRPILGQARAAR